MHQLLLEQEACFLLAGELTYSHSIAFYQWPTWLCHLPLSTLPTPEGAARAHKRYLPPQLVTLLNTLLHNPPCSSFLSPPPSYAHPSIFKAHPTSHPTHHTFRCQGPGEHPPNAPTHCMSQSDSQSCFCNIKDVTEPKGTLEIIQRS